ncbi:SWIB/MDM2 domain family protein [Candida parapsilosis]|uniref:SWIB/MDM2 domain family protein n=1 Tax=Candida parapsilosis TaxID=5480 RepID=A0A8X7NJ63_CANPA|nr:SWIB/MDM2 domain family protein [Candida parapsilosis]KAF6046673.1 SWIB/MDM2 domain family protein [Candida parapsilosis]KAF6050886.1 SWIB/MDM2 domain family protein [Candida parapsilosis]KAF6062392.1 SWIB/MDM2 domain family protein [Candida parapsilosis]
MSQVPLPNQQVVPPQAPPSNNQPKSTASSIPAISYTPTDITIPPSLYDKLPNLKEYRALKEAEKRVDLLIARKALDFQAIQQKTIHPFEYKPNTGILRVFIYNTCEHQPWQNQLAQQEGQQVPENTVPTWTLRVEGRFINDDKSAQEETNSLKFSAFLSGISVDLLENEHYPNLQESHSNIVEWRDDTANNVGRDPGVVVGFDGMDIKREGKYNIKVKIALMVKSFTSKLSVTPDLAEFMGKLECTQQEVMYTIWQYVLNKKLFVKTAKYNHVPAVEGLSESIPGADKDRSAYDDLTLAETDDVLFELLKVREFKFSDLYGLIQPHFKPREPIVIDYEVDTRRSTTLGDVVLDIPTELPINISKAQRELLEMNKSALENLSRHDAMIEKLNQKISLAIIELRNANSRETFYSGLSKDPVKFIEQWLASQAETLKALKSDEGYDEEIVRRANYFEDNEDLINEKIDLLFGSSKF